LINNLKSLKDKLNILFIPFLVTLLALTIGYTLIHWVLFIELRLFSIKNIISNFGIPIVLTGIVTWFFLRPKLKILNFESRNEDWRVFYSLILWISLSVPLIIAQEYIETATGKLVELNSIKEITKSPPAKYYTLKEYYIDKKSIGSHSDFEVAGRHNETFVMEIYVALPIFESEKNTSTKDEPLGWLGLKYSKAVSNRLQANEKEAKYKEFAQQSQIDFERKNVSEFKYLDRIDNADDREGYIKAVKQNPLYRTGEIIFVGVNEPYEARNGEKLKWLLGSALFGSLVCLVLLLMPKINQEQLNRVKSGKPDKKAQRERQKLISFLKLREGYFIMPILVYINIGIYLLMVITGLGFISFKGQDLLSWGANYGPLTKDSEWWRLLTNIFLHGGLMHLLANMYGLWFVGIFLEPLLGRTKFLIVYILTGILASIASIWWYEAVVSVGASGAIFGLYGVFLLLLLAKVYPPDFAKPFLISTSIFVGYNLLMGLAGGIDNAAHIGGLLSGFIGGLILYPTLRRNKIYDDQNG
jgi:rhomboid protease GluP